MLLFVIVDRFHIFIITTNTTTNLTTQLAEQYIKFNLREPAVEEYREMLERKTISQGGLYNLWGSICNEKENPLTIIGYYQSLNVFNSRWPSLKYGEDLRLYNLNNETTHTKFQVWRIICG